MQSTVGPQPGINDCWNQIGVSGNRACPELTTFIHCRNCPVYSAAGRTLLEREAPVGYLHEWTNLLAKEKVEATPFHQKQSSEGGIGETKAFPTSAGSTILLVVFRLGVEWLALSAHLFKEVTPVCAIHTLPHRSNQILLGLVNIRGEIQLCFSLSALLKLETTLPSQHQSHIVYERMVLVEKDGNRWVFPVDEVEGVHRIQADELGNVPATVSKVPESYTKGMLSWRGRSVSYLDDELVFYTLNRRVL